jgi:hypothetical protein
MKSQTNLSCAKSANPHVGVQDQTNGTQVVAQELPNSTAMGIDTQMLEMLKSLHLPEHGAGNFSAALAFYTANLGTALREARRQLADQNHQQLESKALDISQNALKMGASRMLSSAFALQNLARCRAFTEASSIIDEIETEYRKVLQGLEGVV